MSSFDHYALLKNLFVLGTTTSAVGAGGLLFTSYLHIPAYVKNTSDESLLTQWQTMGALGRAALPPLALIAAGANFVNSYLTHGQPQQIRFITAGALSLAILPYTFVALGSTNAELTARAANKETGGVSAARGQDVRSLISQWGTRSAVRGVLMLASAIFSYDAMLHLTF
ncbi:hypothetical protein G647_00389 [Cladophialophora carrionii CBS 160.54]|uniref:DUF1772 domain-containing protein n=1 Tax=Cladophialophora carrionii CBS 160.54 TaxID=1279043 RepID=V9DM54_9EURO|nr:uncharacterized protein G647_00389 [Cladophialophora carrionii CBS 160.54]ETI27940.1 hypothetical protein G647_00389 [Cladophialophora carrionii CBS 160.54]